MKRLEFKGVWFLAVVIVALVGISLFDPSRIFPIIKKIEHLTIKLLPIFVMVIVLTATINYFLKPKKIMKYFGKESGIKGEIFALLGGIVSHGPMYAWYPMLEDMKKHGLKMGLIAVFMYARAIKLPLLPFMVGLFGVSLSIVINLYIILFALLQGRIIDILEKE